MILSYEHKFLFLKTKKTGGTSLELALSPIAGPGAIVTQIPSIDEEMREPGDGPRNFIYDATATDKRRKKYYHHIKGATVRRRIGDAQWNGLFKFTVERNPWDRQVSLYHWRQRKFPSPRSFDEFMKSPNARLHNFGIYSIDGKVITDFVIRYERLQDDFDSVMRRLGFAPRSLQNAKGNFRPPGRHYSEYYSAETRKLVEEWYTREIDAFGYRFEPVP